MVWRPTVSVIVPFYNVEDYIGPCLDSILEQSFVHFEVVLVDDGSPDGSRAVAEQYVARDPRVRLVTRPNGGLGAARNTGIKAARGRYLTFVDSDDVLPVHALAVLVGSARATGSQIVAGSVRRFDEERDWRPIWVTEVQSERRLATNVSEFPPILRNLYTWNKLYERRFWDKQGLWFREGSYEDQPIITQLLCRAEKIDVVPEVVYRYRLREDASSISQQTASTKDLDARITAFRLTHEALLAEGREDLYDAWLQTLFDAHFHWYLMSAGIEDDAYWAKIRDIVIELTADAHASVWEKTMPLRRVVLELTRQDRRDEVRALARMVEATPLLADDTPSRVTPEGVLLEYPGFGDPRLPAELFLLRPEQLKLRHMVEELSWSQGPGGLTARLTGWAYVGKIDLATHEQRVEVVVQVAGDEHVYPAAEQPAPRFPQPFEDASNDHSPGVFGAEVPVEQLIRQYGAEPLRLLLRVHVAGFTVTTSISQLARAGQPGGLRAGRLHDGRRVFVDWSLQEPVILRRIDGAVELVDVELRGRTLRGRLVGAGVQRYTRVVASHRRTHVAGRVVDGRFELRLPDTGAAATWHVTGRDLADKVVPIHLREETADRALLLGADHRDEPLIFDWPAGAVADTVRVEGDELVVEGRAFGPVETVTIEARHRTGSVAGPAAAPAADGRFTARVPLRRTVYRYGELPLPTGDHDLVVRLQVTGAEQPVEAVLRVSAALSDVLPVPVDTDTLEGRVLRGPRADVRITLVRPIGDAAGRYRQARLREAPKQPLRRGILFRSYFGEKATDNGLGIQAELRRRGADLPCYWAVQDHSTPVPEGGIPVVVNTREWYELLGSVTYYVDNMFQPDYMHKQPGQVLVETFHGYPFKQMGKSHWANMGFDPALVRSYGRRAGEWDYLVSPATYATPLLTREFGYDGEVLTIGYPRNDVLFSADRDAIRAQVRASLGIREDQTAVLYAPTFRDYMSPDDMRAAMVDFFDFARAHERLGDGYVLLVRGHAFNARVNQRTRVPGVVDVTDYPEVADLYLAADAAVVDYSSLRFDFGVTGKPMIFHVPDLQRYRDTRGWLFDFEPTAPGPLLDTTDEVVDALLDLDAVRTKYAEAYQRFRDDYLDMEDGRAGARFVDAVLVPRGDAPAEAGR
jgi:CDP-glycerol glycerophosphotransferase